MRATVAREKSHSPVSVRAMVISAAMAGSLWKVQGGPSGRSGTFS